MAQYMGLLAGLSLANCLAACGHHRDQRQEPDRRSKTIVSVQRMEGFKPVGAGPFDHDKVSLALAHWPPDSSDISDIVRAACDEKAAETHVERLGEGFQAKWGETGTIQPDGGRGIDFAYMADIRTDHTAKELKVTCNMLNY